MLIYIYFYKNQIRPNDDYSFVKIVVFCSVLKFQELERYYPSLYWYTQHAIE